jgi:hypothetical protein
MRRLCAKSGTHLDFLCSHAHPLGVTAIESINPARPMEALSRLASGFGSLLRSVIIGLLSFLFPSWYEPDRPYYPEEHYMRGPGPKWRAKHLSNGTSTGKS